MMYQYCWEKIEIDLSHSWDLKVNQARGVGGGGGGVVGLLGWIFAGYVLLAFQNPYPAFSLQSTPSRCPF